MHASISIVSSDRRPSVDRPRSHGCPFSPTSEYNTTRRGQFNVCAKNWRVISSIYRTELFPFKGRFPAKLRSSGALGFCVSSICSRRVPLGNGGTGLLRSECPSCHRVSNHWRKHKALTLTNVLASSFLSTGLLTLPTRRGVASSTPDFRRHYQKSTTRNQKQKNNKILLQQVSKVIYFGKRPHRLLPPLAATSAFVRRVR